MTIKFVIYEYPNTFLDLAMVAEVSQKLIGLSLIVAALNMAHYAFVRRGPLFRFPPCMHPSKWRPFTLIAVFCLLIIPDLLFWVYGKSLGLGDAETVVAIIVGSLCLNTCIIASSVYAVVLRRSGAPGGSSKRRFRDSSG